MKFDSKTINMIIFVFLCVYIVYLLFFLKTVPEIYTIINEAFLNKVFRLLVLVAIVLLSVRNSRNIGGFNIVILLTLAYLLSIIFVNKHNLENFSQQLENMQNE